MFDIFGIIQAQCIQGFKGQRDYFRHHEVRSTIKGNLLSNLSDIAAMTQGTLHLYWIIQTDCWQSFLSKNAFHANAHKMSVTQTV